MSEIARQAWLDKAWERFHKLHWSDSIPWSLDELASRYKAVLKASEQAKGEEKAQLQAKLARMKQSIAGFGLYVQEDYTGVRVKVDPGWWEELNARRFHQAVEAGDFSPCPLRGSVDEWQAERLAGPGERLAAPARRWGCVGGKRRPEEDGWERMGG